MRKSLRLVLLLHGLIASFVVAATAVPVLRAQIGFGGLVVPGRYAPIAVTVSGLGHPTAGSLVVEQVIGNAWRGEAAAAYEIAAGVLTNGTYETSIPVYDPLNPIRFQLVSDRGDPLASHVVDLRDRHRSAPFSAVVGGRAAIGKDDAVASIGPFDLPLQWPAYESLDVLWIAAPPAPSAWESIAQWVLAGGSLVVATGADFYRMDSPILRDLLPIRAPNVVQSDLGVPYVIGEPIPGSRTVLLSRADLPLAICGPYGAGFVTFVAVRFGDLGPDETGQIAEAIPHASMITLDAVGAAAFADLDLGGPSLGATTIVVLLTLTIFSALLVHGRRRPKSAIAGILVVSLCLTVSVALYTNRTKPLSQTYFISSTLSVETSVGIDMESSWFVSFSEKPIFLRPVLPVFPLFAFPEDLLSHDYGFRATTTGTSLGLPVGEAGSYRSMGSGRAPFGFEIAAEEPRKVRVINRTDSACSGLLAVEGNAYPLPILSPGEHLYDLGPETSVEAFMPDLASSTELYRLFVDRFALGGAAWLIVFRETTGDTGGKTASGVRHVALHALRSPRDG